MQNLNTGMLIKRIVKNYILPNKKMLAIAVPAMLVSSGCYALFAHSIMPLIDQVLGTKDNHTIYSFALMIVALFLVRGFTEFIYNFLMERIGLSIVAKLQSEMYAKVIKQDLYFFQNHTVADLISRFIFDLQRLRYAVGQTVVSTVRDISMVLAMIINMLHKDWTLALFSLIVFPPVIFIVRRLGRLTRKYSKSTQVASSEFAESLDETIGGVRQVQIYTMEQLEIKRIDESIYRIMSNMMKAAKIRALTSPMVEIVSMIMFAGVIVYANFQVRAGALTEGAFMSFITTLMLMYRPLKGLSNMNNVVQEGLAAADRAFDVIDSGFTVKDAADAKKLQIKEHDIVFENVTFEYPNGEKATNNLNLELQTGKTVALVGSSGAGKSTVLNLIPRFFDPTSGVIKIGGKNIKDVLIKTLRDKISLVSQEVVLFNDTIYNNIAYGNKNATKEQIIKASKDAAAHQFIEEMENGYNTIVGENGARLSGGQRQRVAIARALIKDAPILLLDEATSSLDTESERQVQKALETLMKGRTTLIVAHRLSTIINADKICVLDKGKLKEQGTHDELLAKGGLYKKLYNMQSKK